MDKPRGSGKVIIQVIVFGQELTCPKTMES